MFRTLRYPKFRLMDYFIIILLGHVKRRPCKNQFNTSYKGPFIMPWILILSCTLHTVHYHHGTFCRALFYWCPTKGFFSYTFFFGIISKLGVFFPSLMFTILFDMWMLGSNKWTFNCKWNSKMMIVKMVLLTFLLIK